MQSLVPGMESFVIATEDPRTTDVTALLDRHLAFTNGESPPEHVHALDVSGLLHSSVSFYTLRDDGALLGVGALKELDPGHGEIKSMHTATEARGRGVGSALLDHILDAARLRGYERVSLETGTMDSFAAARSLYASRGFHNCPPFGDYWHNEYSICMTLELHPA